jgi:hypothetical protein
VDKLAVVTQASLTLQKEVTRYAQAHQRFEDPTVRKLPPRKPPPLEFRELTPEDVEEGEPAFINSLRFKVDETVQAIESANSSSAALGRTLTSGPTFGGIVTEPPKPSTRLRSDE